MGEDHRNAAVPYQHRELQGVDDHQVDLRFAALGLRSWRERARERLVAPGDEVVHEPAQRVLATGSGECRVRRQQREHFGFRTNVLVDLASEVVGRHEELPAGGYHGRVHAAKVAGCSDGNAAPHKFSSERPAPASRPPTLSRPRRCVARSPTRGPHRSAAPCSIRDTHSRARSRYSSIHARPRRPPSCRCH